MGHPFPVLAEQSNSPRIRIDAAANDDDLRVAEFLAGVEVVELEVEVIEL